ncbi:hypothetical protein F7725_001160 [Dissostichus mawsoni]|uniref:Immunoglobulin domain-containing protein n=1 Tax=Dissostichus mawsoni TaxID=36200 RepID=A0A7J5ZGH5_DISMA|nr:hypothetical protein F7725_001160 [Dissostichus mawsoni]
MLVGDPSAEKTIDARTGGNIVVECSFTQNGAKMYLCKEECEGEDNLIERTCKSDHENGRYRIRYTQIFPTYFLFVSIDQLTQSDSGWYRCGLGRPDSKDRYQRFRLIITDGEFLLDDENFSLTAADALNSQFKRVQLTLTDTQEDLISLIRTSCFESSTSLPASPKTPGVILYVRLTLVVLVIVSSLSVLVFCRKRTWKAKSEEPAIQKEIGSIKQARFLSKGRMLVEMINARQQEKLLKMKTLNEVPIKCHVPGANRKMRGVISGVPIEIRIEELKKEIKGGKVSVVKRLPTRYQGKLAKQSSTKCSHKCVIEEDALIVNKYKFVAFIGKVVNVNKKEVKTENNTLQDGNTGLVSAQLTVYSGTEGENVRVKCSFTWNRIRKFFCKETCRQEDILIETTNATAQSGRYRIDYKDGGFFVTISQLIKSDSGRYRCGAGIFKNIEIIVVDAKLDGDPSAEKTIDARTGGNIVVRCNFTQYRANKYFCKEKCEGGDNLVETTGYTFTKKDRFSIRYVKGTPNGQLVYVSIEQLTSLTQDGTGVVWADLTLKIIPEFSLTAADALNSQFKRVQLTLTDTFSHQDFCLFLFTALTTSTPSSSFSSASSTTNQSESSTTTPASSKTTKQPETTKGVILYVFLTLVAEDDPSQHTYSEIKFVSVGSSHGGFHGDAECVIYSVPRVEASSDEPPLYSTLQPLPNQSGLFYLFRLKFSQPPHPNTSEAKLQFKKFHILILFP